MWRQLLKPLRKRSKSRLAPVRRPLRPRLYCEPLEDRCLLSVTLGDGGAGNSGLVGAPVTWTASASGDGSSPVYQFNVQQGSGPYQMVQDYTTSNSFLWNPMQQGSYTIQVNVEKTYGGAIVDTTTANYTANPRATGSNAVVSHTANPLIALYSAPDTSSSGSMIVQFKPLNDPNAPWESTSPQQVVANENTNFIVAGMLPKTTYEMQYVLDGGTPSGQVMFTTGGLPASLNFPTYTIVQPPSAGTDLTDDMIYHASFTYSPPDVALDTTDLGGNINWYYDQVFNNFDSFSPTLAAGGKVLMLGGNRDTIGGSLTDVRETDLLGDLLHDTNIYALNAQLANNSNLQKYDPIPIINLNHEVQLLPNGDVAVIASAQKYTNGALYTGTEILVMDQNFQVNWLWNSFDFMDTNRLGTDGERPNDWLHTNAISWSPEDGNLLLSMRAQDWMVKINYDDGNGDGSVLWRLGYQGNFTLNTPSGTSIPPNTYSTLWFSHQHDARYINDNTIVVFDDGNTRRMTNPNADSRGQEWVLNEQTMTATLVVNADLGNYSPALGGAQMLPNGNLVFTSGNLYTPSAIPYAQSIEVSSDGTQTYRNQENGALEYRTYFVNNLYQGVNFTYGLQDAGFEEPNQGTGNSSDYLQDPTDSTWTFSGTAGVAGNGSSITNGNPNAPQGTQVAYIQQSATISQVVRFLTPGNYTLSLQAAQAASNANNEEIEVQVDGTTVATFTPTSTSYALFTTPSFNVTAGSHTIAFIGSDTGSNDTALLDAVNLTYLPATGTATYLTTDTTTQGNWLGTYGRQGYSIVNNASSFPSYVQASVSGNTPYIWANSTNKAAALQQVGDSNNRIAATWFAANSFTEYLNFTDGQTHQLALYLLDWDDLGNRNETITINNATTGAQLSQVSASNFANGEYLVFNVSGNIAITFTNNNSSSNAVLSGLFIDPESTTPPAGGATFVGTDTTTQGNWQGVYGSDGYNVIDSAAKNTSYAQVNAVGISNYVWNNSSNDPRALEEAGSSSNDGMAACWFSSSNFTIYVDITDGATHQLALYLLDWEHSSSYRNETIQIFDATNPSKILDTQTLSNFYNGEYVVWNVSGDIGIKFINNNSSRNAVVSGLFFDPALPPPSAGGATFVGTDTTHQGSWQGVYGSDGYNVLDDAVQTPSYAQVRVSGNSNYIWAYSTTDARALQRVENPSNGIAACWFSSSSFTINVNITDGGTHQLALYLLDWENVGSPRSETITLTNALNGSVLDTETASNFYNGEYLVWDVSGDINITFTNTNSARNAVVSGLFFGGPYTP